MASSDWAVCAAFMPCDPRGRVKRARRERCLAATAAPSAAERVPQGSPGGMSGDLDRRRAGRRRGGRRRWQRAASCTKRNCSTSVRPKWRVDPLRQRAGQMLQLERDRARRRRGSACARRSRRGGVTAASAGPTISAQSAMTCAAAGERAAERRPGDGRQQRADRPRAVEASRLARGLPGLVARHTAPVPPSLRPPPRCSAGTTGIAALCHGAPRPASARPISRLAVTRSCCSRPRWRRSGPYFERFLARFPTVEALAAAPRGRRCCRPGPGSATTPAPATCTPAPASWRRRGGFPRDLAGLRALPGIGAYTAAAVASIAFGVPVVPVDGNVERVAARVFAIDRPLPAGPRRDRRRRPQPRRRPGARRPPRRFHPGAVRPRRHDLHAAHARLRPVPVARRMRRPGGRDRAELPRKAPQAGAAASATARISGSTMGPGQVLLRRRAPTGLLGAATLELPGTPWRPESLDAGGGTGLGAGDAPGGVPAWSRTASPISSSIGRLCGGGAGDLRAGVAAPGRRPGTGLAECDANAYGSRQNFVGRFIPDLTRSA